MPPSNSDSSTRIDASRYRPLHVHATGGLGEVLLAEDMELGRQVALKQIQRQYADDPASRRRFLTEAEVTARLEHPGIVPVYGLGIHADGRPYYAMRFIKGESLEQAITAFHGIPPENTAERNLALRQLLRRFIDVCNAIAYAHSRGILHRDLKPANIMLGPYGETLVVDWGLAKSLGKREPEMAALTNEQTLVLRDTITVQMALDALKAMAEEEQEASPLTISSSGTIAGVLLGTPAFMSPEQAAGVDQVGAATDVYSLGTILYSLLTGRDPFQGQLQDVLHEVQAGEFPAPRAFAPQVPRALEAICLKAMSLRPEDRFHTCREMAEDIERWLADEPVTCYVESRLARARRWMRRHKSAVNSVALGLAFLVLGLALVVIVEAVSIHSLAAKNARLRSTIEELEQTKSP